MPPNPVLTRIVTCYKQWPYLAEWISDDSLFVPWVSWIVVNDCPAEACPTELAEKLKARGVLLLTPELNQGRSEARNLGVHHASTLWIEHVDGDDRPTTIDPASLSAAENADIICYPVSVFPDGTPPPRDSVHVPFDPNQECYWGFLLPNFRPIDPRPASLVWRRDYFLKLGGYSSRFEGSEDLHLLWMASQSRARLSRFAWSKQAYRDHNRIHIRQRAEYFEALRFYQWLRRHCEPAQERALDLLIGRQYLAVARLFFRDLWRDRGKISAYLGARRSGEFYRLYR